MAEPSSASGAVFLSYASQDTEAAARICNALSAASVDVEGPEYYPWQQDLFTEDPYAVRGGRVHVRDRPGSGVTIRPEWLTHAAYQCSETRA